MWPDSETRIDLVNVRHLVGAVVGIVQNDDLLPVTIGVFGDWGSGKSSVMKMVEAELADAEGTLCIVFNGWLFEGYEDAKAALMGSILDALMDESTLGRKLTDRAHGLAKRLFRRVDWFRLMGMAGKNILSFTLTGLPDIGTLGQAATVAAEKLKGMEPDQAKDLIKEAPEGQEAIRRTVREFRADFAELLRLSGVERLVVFIDDLDRCLPDTVIDTLEAIRLFLFVERSAFIIGADEGLVEHAVRLRFPEVKTGQLDVGRDYLEKLVQIPVRIPPLGPVEVETYVNLLLAKQHLPVEVFEALTQRLLDEPVGTLQEAGFSSRNARSLIQAAGGGEPGDALREDLALGEQVSDVLAAGLEGNPRQVKRFLNTLLLRIRMAETRGIELRRRVLAKVMVLEYLKPLRFEQLAHWQAEQEGEPVEIAALEAALREAHAPASAGGQGAGAEGVAPPWEGSVASAAPSVAGADGKTSAEGTSEGTVVLPDRASEWEDDEWLRAWVRTDPELGGVDLRPYFYFAREKVGVLGTTGHRLSRPAQEALALFVSPSDADTVRAVDRSAALSPADAAAVFNALTERVRRADQPEARAKMLGVLLQLAERRHELMGEAVVFLETLSPSAIPMAVPLRIRTISQGTAAEAAAERLLKSWADAGSRQLQTAATTALRKLK